MSTETQETAEMGTKPVHEHEWLNNLIGEWRTETEMWMGPDEPKMTSTGTDSVKSLGGLWAQGNATGTMPDGTTMNMVHGLGWDVSFKEYRGFWIASMSSHLWIYKCELSADGKVMTMNCEGPDMEKEGETAQYRDVIELIDSNHRTLTSFGPDEKGGWQEFMKTHYYRV